MDSAFCQLVRGFCVKLGLAIGPQDLWYRRAGCHVCWGSVIAHSSVLQVLQLKHASSAQRLLPGQLGWGINSCTQSRKLWWGCAWVRIPRNCDIHYSFAVIAVGAIKPWLHGSGGM